MVNGIIVCNVEGVLLHTIFISLISLIQEQTVVDRQRYRSGPDRHTRGCLCRSLPFSIHNIITAVHIELGAEQIGIGIEREIKTAAILGSTPLNDHIRQIQSGTFAAHMDHTAFARSEITARKRQTGNRYRDPFARNGEHTVFRRIDIERLVHTAHTGCQHRNFNNFARSVLNGNG